MKRAATILVTRVLPALMAECDALEIEKVGRQVRRMSGLEK